MKRLFSLLLKWFQQKVPDAPVALTGEARELAEEAAAERGVPVEQVTGELIAAGLELSAPEAVEPPRWRTLTERQREAATHVALGGSYRQIAEAMGISKETVRSHIRAAQAKYGVHGKAALQAAVLLEMGEDFSRLSRPTDSE